jgi:acyl-CoA thioesterase FadM
MKNAPPWQPLAVTYRGFVYPWQLDRHGRMHVQTHALRFDEASGQLLSLLGLGPHRLAEESKTFITLEQQITYTQPIGAPAALHIESELLEIGATTLRYRHTLCDSETRQPLSTMERLIALVEVESRRPADLPAALTRRAQVLFPAVAVHVGTQDLALAA